MDHDAGRFVYDDQLIIFIDYFKWKIFRREQCWERCRKFNFNFVVRVQLVRRLGDATIDQHVGVFDQPLQASTAPAFDVGNQKGVKTLAGID